MALINKIREKSGWAIGIIAVSLGLFMVGSDIFGPNSRIFGSDQHVGKIAGEKIDLPEFQTELDQARYQYAASTGQNPSEEQMGQIRDQAWNNLVFQFAYQKEFDKLGLTVTDDEVYDMVQGSHIDPGLQQAPIFQNPSTKQFDKNLVIMYLNQLNSDSIPPQQVAQWQLFEDQLRKSRLQNKYINLLKNSAYVTKAEAKQEYTAQTAKATAKFLYVPFFSIPDSGIKVTDDQLRTYLNDHKEQYKGEERRSVQYVTFSILPSGKDSADLLTEIKQLAKGLATAPNDSAFANANTDVPFPGSYRTIGDLPQQLQGEIATFIKGGMYGPYREGDTYSIYKLADIKDDTAYSARASHILFKADSSAASQAEALRKAREVLAQIRGGAPFEEMARQHGTDGTAQSGGDLGWFSEGRMVKPFERAVMNFGGTGLLPEPVKTDFGYHIIKVTQPKTNRTYKIYAIQKTLSASDETRDEAYRKASAFLSNSQTLEAFRANLKKDPSLAAFTADQVRPSDNFVNTLQNAREIVRWAYDDETEIGQVADQVFELETQYVVAALTGASEKGEPSIDAYRDEITAKVRNQLKAEQILSKLGNGSGTLESIAQKYGAQAQVNTATDVTMASNTLQNVGFDPVALGKIFGLKQGQRSKPFAGENGVLLVELVSTTPAPEIADYSQYKNQIQQTNGGRANYFIERAINEHADIEDNRYKFF